MWQAEPCWGKRPVKAGKAAHDETTGREKKKATKQTVHFNLLFIKSQNEPRNTSENNHLAQIKQENQHIKNTRSINQLHRVMCHHFHK